MNFLKQAMAVGALIGCLGGFQSAVAAEAPQPQGKQAGQAATALKEDAVCTRCHDESETKPILAIYQTRHGVRADSHAPTCQSCHGKSEKHLHGDPKAKGRQPPDIVFGTKTGAFHPSDAKEQNSSCMACHANSGGKRNHWEGSQHESRDVACASCHTTHAKADPVLNKRTQTEVCFTCHKTERAQTHRISTHPLNAGKMSCSDCHNPHGSTGPKMLVKNTLNETCYTCHAEKRGPFLWEHGPVTDDCNNCHTPHGSVTAPLLKARVPWLCQECHSGDHGNQINSGANLQSGNVTTINGALPLASAGARAQTTARACLNCHMLVHGSNHPAGAKYQR
ncbi:MAG: DmsE family decaheme c-type cytochrome [Sulfuricella sp.]|nr:DmsE family decaheme c-type cytochrome [Sulfuricella sp.]